MLKKNWYKVRDFIVKNSKLIFPVLLMVIVAVTVVLALNANKVKEEVQNQEMESVAVEEQQEKEIPNPEDVPLAENTDAQIYDLVTTYYNAKGEGDTEQMATLCNAISETDLLYYAQLSEFIDHYSDIEVYTKQGPEEGSVVAYVYFKMGIVNYEDVPGYEALYICKDEAGKLYIKSESSFTDEERAYIKTINEQVDVVEFNNRVNVEYNDLMSEKPELLEYLGILGNQVQTAVGEILASQNAEVVDTEENTDENDIQEQPTQEQPGDVVEEKPQYAKASTTVNVRSSDSEKADKLGKLSNGTRVLVQEVKANGWIKIVFDGKDGYVKADYLKLEESVEGLEVIGTVKATTNINVRSAASETADRLGVLAGGETLDLIANEDGWCKVKYNGQVGYVKADYVTQQ